MKYEVRGMTKFVWKGSKHVKLGREGRRNRLKSNLPAVAAFL